MRSIFISQLLLFSGSLFAQSGHIDSLGRKQGQWTEYDTIAHLTSTCFYKDGKPDSTWQNIYKNGQTESVIRFKNGVREGESTSYYPDGKMKSLEFYRNGKAEWKSTFDKNGFLVVQEIFGENGNYSILHFDKGKFVTYGHSPSR